MSKNIYCWQRRDKSGTKKLLNFCRFPDPSYRLSAESGVSGKLAREELNLLAKLIGTAEVQSQETFRINLFDPDMGAEEPEQ